MPVSLPSWLARGQGAGLCTVSRHAISSKQGQDLRHRLPFTWRPRLLKHSYMLQANVRSLQDTIGSKHLTVTTFDLQQMSKHDWMQMRLCRLISEPGRAAYSNSNVKGFPRPPPRTNCHCNSSEQRKSSSAKSILYRQTALTKMLHLPISRQGPAQ